jgi:Fe-S oxidoreductase
MYNPKDIIDLIATNVRKTRNPFGVPATQLNTWWQGLTGGGRRRDDALLFTGLMYQSIPYIEATTGYLERYENTPRANTLMKLGKLRRLAPNALVGWGLNCMVDCRERKKFNGILTSIYRLLKKSEVGFFYLPELDFYSGVLLYDLGDQEGFVDHARYVADVLRLHRVEKIITVDPHTTYALKELYPKYIGTSFEVTPYFTRLKLNGGNGGARVAVHDPCFYGRYLELSETPANLLHNLGIECVPVRRSGTMTHCCGGPAESVSPSLNREILTRRVEELQETGAPVVTMCPICLANLIKAGVRVDDLANVVAAFL